MESKGTKLAKLKSITFSGRVEEVEIFLDSEDSIPIITMHGNTRGYKSLELIKFYKKPSESISQFTKRVRTTIENLSGFITELMGYEETQEWLKEDSTIQPTPLGDNHFLHTGKGDIEFSVPIDSWETFVEAVWLNSLVPLFTPGPSGMLNHFLDLTLWDETVKRSIFLTHENRLGRTSRPMGWEGQHQGELTLKEAFPDIDQVYMNLAIDTRDLDTIFDEKSDIEMTIIHSVLIAENLRGTSNEHKATKVIQGIHAHLGNTVHEFARYALEEMDDEKRRETLFE